MKIRDRITSTVAAQFVAALIGVAYSIITAKGLGPGLRGVFFVAQAFFALGAQLATVSVQTIMTVQLSRGEFDAAEVNTTAVILSTALGLVASMVTSIVYLRTYGASGIDWRLVLLFFGGMPFFLYKTMWGGMALGLGQITRLNVMSVLDISITALLTFVAVIVLHAGIEGALLGYFCSSVLVAGWCASRAPSTEWKISRTCVRTALHLGWQQHLSFIAGQVYLRADAFILAAFASPAAIGNYAVARGLADRITLAINPISQVMFPVIASAERDRSRWYTRVTVRALFTIGAVALAAFVVLAPVLIPLVYGRTYTPAVRLSQILALSIAVLTIQVPLNLWFLGNLKRPLLCTCVNIVTVVLVLTFGVPLARAYGAMGMAWAMVVAFAFSSLFAVIVANRVSLGLRSVVPSFRELRTAWMGVTLPRESEASGAISG